MRSPSRDPEPHRVLKLDPKDPMRGEDVRALQVATTRRLEARGIDRDIAYDGVYGLKTHRACKTASHILGALKSTHDAPLLSIGEQAMIRYPGRRTDAQLARANARMDALLKDRKLAARRAAAGGDVVDRALAAFNLAYRHRSAVHYTQGGLRWQGIREHLKASEGEFPNWADCSSMFTWCYWQALGNGPDILNGSGWSAGFTGTLLAHGTRLRSPEKGCAIIYGHGFPGKHVTMYDKDGMAYSHGSEAGPLYVHWRYRSDVMAIVRYAHA